MDTCYALVADRVSPQAWETFSSNLDHGFSGFPEAWALPEELCLKLVLRLQWHVFNPDLVEGDAARRARSWAFMTSFLAPAFQRKFHFLRARCTGDDLERWDRSFADFETLLYLSSMDDTLQLDWLSTFDARIRYGAARRARVIKNTGLGLASDILGVHALMSWPEIRARYRFLLKMHHPDVGGDPEQARLMIQEFQRLADLAGKRD